MEELFIKFEQIRSKEGGEKGRGGGWRVYEYVHTY